MGACYFQSSIYRNDIDATFSQIDSTTMSLANDLSRQRYCSSVSLKAFHHEWCLVYDVFISPAHRTDWWISHAFCGRNACNGESCRLRAATEHPIAQEHADICCTYYAGVATGSKLTCRFWRYRRLAVSAASRAAAMVCWWILSSSCSRACTQEQLHQTPSWIAQTMR